MLLLIYCFLTGFILFSQSVESSTVEVRLYLPAHVKALPAAGTKLEIFFTTFLSDSVNTGIPKKVVARKVKENVYEFQLPHIRFWHIGFSYGKFSSQLLCINNKDGNAGENYDFKILLNPIKVDFAHIKFLPPCLTTDEEK